MTTTLRDFIARRETEIREQQRALKTELRELQLAKAALEGQAETATLGSPSMTIKEMAREVLSGQPNGLNSAGILDGIRKLFNREIERTSLSPQLSRLKEDGELLLENDVWFTTQHYQAKAQRDLNALLSKYGPQIPEQASPIGEGDDDEDLPF